VTGGLLKNFTDENYKNALATGQNAVNATLKQLNETPYPDFEAFKAAREKATADLHAQLQKNVAYAELAEILLKGLEELSQKMQLKFNVSDAEKEKEQLILEKERKNVEQAKKDSKLQEAFTNSQQLRTNVESERNLLAEQNERQTRDWKAKIELESKLREQQIIADLKAGFDERANQLKAELVSSQKQTMTMMMQMQKENKESQAKLMQLLTVVAKPPPPPVVVRPPGPITALIQGLLGALI